jgi:hypothetical protein
VGKGVIQRQGDGQAGRHINPEPFPFFHFFLSDPDRRPVLRIWRVIRPGSGPHAHFDFQLLTGILDGPGFPLPVPDGSIQPDPADHQVSVFMVGVSMLDHCPLVQIWVHADFSEQFGSGFLPFFGCQVLRRR